MPVHDHNGNIACLLDPATGSPVETYRHTAFGEETIFGSEGEQIEKAISPWRFSSKRVDEETGFVYFGRRYYSPVEGRWITAGPIGFDKVTSFTKSAISTAGEFVDWAGLHFIPFPDAQDKVRSIGTVMQGGDLKDFKGWRENRSYCKSLGLPEKDPMHRIVLIGGVLTSEATMKARAEQLSAALGGYNVHYMYNSSHGTLADFGEWVLQRLGIETRSARVFARECGKLLDEMGGVEGGGTLHIFAHSQGGEITNNLNHHLGQDQMSKMNVRTFGSPRQIEDGKFGKVANFASASDPVPKLNYLSWSFWRSNAITITLPSNAIYGTDHSWDNDTYQGAIAEEIKRLNKRTTGNKQ